MSRLTHGDSPRGERAPEYWAWIGMKSRCYNLTCSDYERYGGRGVIVCDEWRDDYVAFLDHVGRKPSPEHTLDRYPDKNGNYEPGNVRWATSSEQQANLRNNNLITVGDLTLNLSEWSRKTGLFRSVITGRLKLGWTIEQALGLVPKPAYTRPLSEERPYRGVYFDSRSKSPWRAVVYDPRTQRTHYVGGFANDYDAATAYNFAALELLGDNVLFNTPKDATGGHV